MSKISADGLKKLQKGIQHEKYLVALKGVKEDEDNESAAMGEKFAAKQDNTDQLISDATTGRQSLSDYRRKRMRIQLEMGMSTEELEEKKRKKLAKEEADESKAKETKKLSFKVDDDDDDEDDDDDRPTLGKKTNNNNNNSNSISFKSSKISKIKMGKDPTVNTSFLPDKERDELALLGLEKQRAEWLDEQERIKEELFTIDYCYYDGTSHKKTMTLKKGESIRTFLDEARLNFPELKGVSLNDLMFVKDHYNVPDHYTFYELFEIRSKDSTYDTFSRWTDLEQLRTVQLGVQSTQLARIVERNFYEKNHASMPFSNWVLFSDDGLKKIPIFNSQLRNKYRK